MKVNDYVRTDDGLIGKIVSEPYEYKDSIGHDIDFGDNNIYNEYEMYQDIIKSSPDIIDILEVGDYVNGMEVTRIGGTRWDKNDLHCYCEHNGNENWKQVMIPAKDIKSIVTKEQFSCMEYKIGE